MAVEPAASPVLSGVKAGPHKIPGIGAGFIPPFYDASLVDEVMTVTDDDARKMLFDVAATEGLPIGFSAGAAISAAVELAKRADFVHANIVVVVADSAERYLSTL